MIDLDDTRDRKTETSVCPVFGATPTEGGFHKEGPWPQLLVRKGGVFLYTGWDETQFWRTEEAAEGVRINPGKRPLTDPDMLAKWRLALAICKLRGVI